MVTVLFVVFCVLLLGRTFYRGQHRYSALKSIGIALDDYVEKYERFPDMKWENGNGVSLSYRVLIMEFLGEDSARGVAVLARTCRTFQELEASDAFVAWKATAEGEFLTNSPYEFVAVSGPWVTWGGERDPSNLPVWHEFPAPIVVAVSSGMRTGWCAPDLGAVVDGDILRTNRIDAPQESSYITVSNEVLPCHLEPGRRPVQK